MDLQQILAVPKEKLHKVSKVKVNILPDVESLYQHFARSIADEIKQDNAQDYPIRVEEGDLREGLKRAVNLQKEGVKAIISRGGSALLIKSSANIYIPVIEIKVTGYDLSEALAKAI